MAFKSTLKSPTRVSIWNNIGLQLTPPNLHSHFWRELWKTNSSNSFKCFECADESDWIGLMTFSFWFISFSGQPGLAVEQSTDWGSNCQTCRSKVSLHLIRSETSTERAGSYKRLKGLFVTARECRTAVEIFDRRMWRRLLVAARFAESIPDFPYRNILDPRCNSLWFCTCLLSLTRWLWNGQFKPRPCDFNDSTIAELGYILWLSEFVICCDSVKWRGKHDCLLVVDESLWACV